MERIARNKNFLQLLINSKKKVRDLLIKNATKDQLDSIREIVFNLLKGNFSIDDDYLKKLSKKKKQLRLLVRRKTTLKKRKEIIQKGGFLQFIVPAIISGLATIVSSIIDKK